MGTTGKTRRAAHKDVRRFWKGQEAPSRNSGCPHGPARSAGAPQGVLSFGYFSLHKQRKVTRAKARKQLLAIATIAIHQLFNAYMTIFTANLVLSSARKRLLRQS